MTKKIILKSPANTPATESSKEKQKKKYQKPALIYQAPLEAMAVTCTSFGGKSGPGTGCTVTRS